MIILSDEGHGSRLQNERYKSLCFDDVMDRAANYKHVSEFLI